MHQYYLLSTYSLWVVLLDLKKVWIRHLKAKLRKQDGSAGKMGFVQGTSGFESSTDSLALLISKS